MNDREVEWICYPADLYFSKEFSFQEKAFLIEIRSLGKREIARGCWAQNQHFAAQFDLSISRVSEIISGLAKKGMISVSFQRDGKVITERNIFLTEMAAAYWTGMSPPSEKAIPKDNPFGKGEAAPSEKAKENSTKDNSSRESVNASARVVDLFATLDDPQPEQPEPSKAMRPARKKATSSEFDQEFDNAFWPAYRRKDGKQDARKAYAAARRKGNTAELIFNGVEKYFELCDIRGTEDQFIKTPAAWLNSGRFMDDFDTEIENAKRTSNRPRGHADASDRLASMVRGAIGAATRFQG